jgi:hypothetical protein
VHESEPTAEYVPGVHGLQDVADGKEYSVFSISQEEPDDETFQVAVPVQMAFEPVDE